MNRYQAPIRDVLFCLNELHDYPAHYRSLPQGAGIGPDDVQIILEELAKFAEAELDPLNCSGDTEGATWRNGVVTTPTGFRDAYQRYVAAGWPRLGQSECYGGQVAPASLKQIAYEFLQSANHAWCMYVAIADGSIKTLLAHAAPAQIKSFVPLLVSGECLGTMCLTEPQCGSDLGQLRAKAEPTAEGTYRITGTKIFISGGEHDLTDNIVHLVLARLPGAPRGTRGISLFVVPKRKLNTDGTSGAANAAHCLGIEHKMGIKGSATCTMSFDGAEGWLVGEANRGLNCMFVFINKSRLSVAQQAQGHAEAAFQATLAYAHERLAGRAPGGAIAPDKAADPLIAQPDIRRMLLTQKAIAEGGRALVLLCAKWVDLADHDDAQIRAQGERMLALLIPITKGAVSELATEATDLGVQVLGGHGYINESGLEQRVRDVRVTRIYEGTTGIQGMDLLGRKILGTQRSTFQEFTQEIIDYCEPLQGGAVAELLPRLKSAVIAWLSITDEIETRAATDANFIAAVAVDYLMLSGYVTLGYMWAQAAVVAEEKLRQGCNEEAFYRAKVETARFYFDKLLPRTATLLETIKTGSISLMAADLHY